ncbi:flagellar type III secretion system pore protein FliP [uncultured Clostridium sp.]|uniref:flagellar type III secretion system pore protein FliP n=1 Tax=uncultured Clostridium sp. TaxID=59620 RepID=UPI002611F6AF|nr:flagellar type III secretion system pore protein FliP [uncultured Clostridium sp.]
MKNKKFFLILALSLLAIIVLNNSTVLAEPADITLSLGDTPKEFVGSIKLMMILTVLTLLPSFIIMTTCFTRIAVVLSFFKSAIGAQQSIPAQVLVGLALFTTIFVMAPVMTEINDNALEPYMANEITQEEAIKKGSAPIRTFMLKETRQKDLELFIDMAKIDKTEITRENIPLVAVVPAFIISELKTAFEIGFLIYLPFLVIDMVVASVLMSMGMFMLPPVMISLPFKLLLFVMVDGWHLLIKSLVQSFM